jgi:hypothetical protein
MQVRVFLAEGVFDPLLVLPGVGEKEGGVVSQVFFGVRMDDLTRLLL